MLVVLAAIGVAWYFRRRYTRSLLPVFLLSGFLIMKVVALLIEDADDRGDDIGIGIVLMLSILTWSVIYVRTRSASSG